MGLIAESFVCLLLRSLTFEYCLFRLASLQTSFVTLDEALKGKSPIWGFYCIELGRYLLLIAWLSSSVQSNAVTNRRVNALENVTIPKIEGILDYIARELDELEREGKKGRDCVFESGIFLVSIVYFWVNVSVKQFSPCHLFLRGTDFTRLKLVQGKKEIEQAREAKQHADEMAKILAAGGNPSASKHNEEDITAQFDAQDDEDVVF